MSRWKVDLTFYEMLIASMIGGASNAQALLGGWGGTSGQADEHKFGNNIEGRCAEIAVGKVLNIYVPLVVGDLKAPDLGPYQVRCNCSRKWDHMNVRQGKDERKKNCIWISVRAATPTFFIDGWIWGDEAMQNKETCKWFRDGAPGRPKSWWVPREMLHSMEELPSVEETLRLMRQRNVA